MQYVFEGVFDDRDFDLDENKKNKRGAYYKGDKVKKSVFAINSIRSWVFVLIA